MCAHSKYISTVKALLEFLLPEYSARNCKIKLVVLNPCGGGSKTKSKERVEMVSPDKLLLGA